MSVASNEFDPSEEMKFRLRVAEIMVWTATALMLRSEDESRQREILEELRRNILVGVASFYPSADPAAILAREEGADRVLDEIVRLSRSRS